MSRLVSLALFTLMALMLFLSSCNSNSGKFRVQGEIASAEDKTLYFEHRGLGAVELLDSVKLQKSGKFSFKETSPQNPEFYQLRMDDNKIIFAVDSMETLNIKADGSDLFNSYTIESSLLNDQIKEVINKQRITEKDISDLTEQHTAKKIDDVTFLEKIDSVLTIYKEYASNLILGNPSSAVAYYAVFQKIDGYLIFDPYDKKDYAMFGAVATSWNRFFPETQRTKHLYEFTMNALRTRKQEDRQSDFLSNVNVTESELPDISLTNVEGNRVSLSSFMGSYVLLDFTVYKADFSLKHNAIINRVYDQYSSKGLVIYQISFDSDRHFWKNAALELPWNSVYDPQSINSELLRTYNIRELPTAYILNKEGELIKRIEDFESIEREISNLL
ncbi:MAG TPA: TlpA disulfide reductase family protein [Dysgonamonadaceae bacterium]|nr:TlpA disulfide reductase family protein [Dysgonamonadaceae bacterium]